LSAAVTLVAIGALLGLRGGRAPVPGSLMTIERPASGATPAAAPSTYIAFAAPGAAPRNLTEDLYSAAFPSPSYDGLRFLFAGRKDPSRAPAVWERGTNGSGLRKISEGYGDPAEPLYLSDGRILFSDHPPGSAAEARSLFSCAADGTDLRRLTFGEQRDSRPRLLSDGRVRFERRVLSPAVSSAALDLVIHPDGTGMSAFVSSDTAAVATEPAPGAKAPDGGRVLAATPAEPRTLPPVLTSVVRPERKTGTLLCLDVYASTLPAIAALPRGAIQRVRIAALGAGGEESLAGEAPVAADGSFFVEVPADLPLRIHLLGEGGKVLASFSSGIWVRPNENHACLGCHEDRELAPENRQPLALQRGAVSLQLALTGKGGSGGP
jgi:hypothetical protein